MKITIVLGAFFPVPPIRGGAVEKSWFALAQEFAARRNEVTMISRWLPGLARDETAGGIAHRRVNGFETPRSLVWLKLLDLIYSWRARGRLPAADILVTNTFWLPILVRDRTRGKIYVNVGRYPKGQMRWYAHAARLQTPSHDIAEAIVREAPALAARTIAIPNPAPTPSIAPRQWSERENVVLYLGRVHPEKGVHLLVEAFSRLAAPSWKLVIIGPTKIEGGGGGENYQRDLEKRAANGRIILRGPIFREEELAREFEAARLFVYPSLADRGETFGLAPLEAMAHGCAVLVSNLACFRDFVIPGLTGFVFDHAAPDPVAALTTKMRELLNDESKLAEVAAAGRRKAAEFSVPRVADQFLADFASLV